MPWLSVSWGRRGGAVSGRNERGFRVARFADTLINIHDRQRLYRVAIGTYCAILRSEFATLCAMPWRRNLQGAATPPRGTEFLNALAFLAPKLVQAAVEGRLSRDQYRAAARRSGGMEPTVRSAWVGPTIARNIQNTAVSRRRGLAPVRQSRHGCRRALVRQNASQLLGQSNTKG
jgi:hypothetical protein